jgi:hypothetical protein
LDGSIHAYFERAGVVVRHSMRQCDVPAMLRWLESCRDGDSDDGDSNESVDVGASPSSPSIQFVQLPSPTPASSWATMGRLRSRLSSPVRHRICIGCRAIPKCRLNLVMGRVWVGLRRDYLTWTVKSGTRRVYNGSSTRSGKTLNYYWTNIFKAKF